MLKQIVTILLLGVLGCHAFLQEGNAEGERDDNRFCPEAEALQSQGCRCTGQPGRINVACMSRIRPSPTDNLWTFFRIQFHRNTAIMSIYGYNIRNIHMNAFSSYPNLQTLNLENNKIQSLTTGAFDSQKKLSKLSLRNNEISEIKLGAFVNLTSLRNLNLQQNSITNIEWQAFREINNAQYLEIFLAGNLIQCDCGVQPFIEWYNSPKSKLILTNATCTNYQSDIGDLFKNAKFNADCLKISPTVAVASSPVTTTKSSPIDYKRTCVVCNGEVDQCSNSPTVLCAPDQNACETSILYDRDRSVPTIKKGCKKVATTCPSNAVPIDFDDCYDVNVGIHCTYCCDFNNCNGNNNHFVSNPITYNYALNGRVSKEYEKEVFDGVGFDHPEAMILLDATQTTIMKKLNETLPAKQKPFIATVRLTGAVDDVIIDNDITATLSITFMRGPSVAINDLDLWNTLYGIISNMADAQNIKAFVPSTIELDSKDLCEADITTTSLAGEIKWATTRKGAYTQPCPNKPSKLVMRDCITGPRSMEWGKVQDSLCGVFTKTTEDLINMHQTIKGELTDKELTNIVDKITTTSEGSPNFTTTEVELSIDLMAHLVDKSISNMSSKDLGKSVSVLNNIISAPDESLQQAQDEQNSVKTLLNTIEDVSLHAPLTKGTMKESRSHIIIAATEIYANNFSGIGYTADLSSGAYNFEFSSGVKTMEGVYLPRDILNNVGLGEGESTRAHFVVYNENRLFTILTNQQNDNNVNSKVISASVGEYRITDLVEPIKITLYHKNPNMTDPHCVYWSSYNETWSQLGCRLSTSESNETYTTCLCDHLTNFALLMNVHGEGHEISAVHHQVLTIISLVGCGVSIGGLLLTIITYLLFRKLRRGKPSKILINLCIALAFLNLFFIFSIQTYTRKSKYGCMVVAVFLHYFLVSAHVWMAVEAFYMYVALVKVFNTHFDKFLLKCCLIGWGIPIVVVAITLGIDKTDNYGLQYERICWLEQTAFYGAVLGPIALIMILNFIAFCLVIKQITGTGKKKLNKSDHTDAWTQLRGGIGVAILLGLTWIFAVFAVGEATLAFQYLFAIFNSLQGLFIFVFYCMLKKDAQNAWIRSFCPGSDYSNSFFRSSSKGQSSTSRGISKPKLSLAQSRSNGSAGTATTGFNSYSGNGHMSRPSSGGDVYPDDRNEHRRVGRTTTYTGLLY